MMDNLVWRRHGFSEKKRKGQPEKNNPQYKFPKLTCNCIWESHDCRKNSDKHIFSKKSGGFSEVFGKVTEISDKIRSGSRNHAKHVIKCNHLKSPPPLADYVVYERPQYLFNAVKSPPQADYVVYERPQYLLRC